MLAVCQIGTLFSEVMHRYRFCHTYFWCGMHFEIGCQELLVDGRGTDLIFFQFAVECVAADAKTTGGLFFVPAAFLQNFSE